VAAAYGTQSAVATHEVTVLPVALSLTQNQHGDVQINNDSPYSIDVSGYRLRGEAVVTLPDRTWLLPRQTITVPKDTVGATNHTMVALYDSRSTLVGSALPDRLQTSFASAQTAEPTGSAAVAAAPAAAAPAPAPVDTSNFNFATTPVAAAAAPPVEPAPTAPLAAASALSTNPPATTTQWPLYALIALLAASCVVVLVQPKLKANSLDTHE
jgi:hypothetical protein